MVGPLDLKVYRSTSDLGGAITGTQISSATPNNLFVNVPNNERVTGSDFYKCVYFKNTHATESMDNFTLWHSNKSFPSDTIVKWGFDPSTTAQTVANAHTAPTGVAWNVIGSEPTTPNKGNFAAGANFPVWIWYHVNANAESRLDDSELFSFSFDIPQGGTSPPPPPGGGGGGGNPPPVNADYKIAFCGDWGCTSVTDDVLRLVTNGGYNFLVGVGDNAYASSSCWTSRFSSIKNAGKFNSAYGNHEYSESGGVSPYKTFFGHSLTYFTFKVQNIQFFVFDSNLNCDPGSNQHTFITNALNQSLTDNTVTWRFAIGHHPAFGASSTHGYNENNEVQNFMSLFISKKVNFWITGHNHNWQRSDQVSYNSGSPSNPNVVDDTPPFLSSTAALIHVITGTGGHDTGSGLYGLGSQPAFNAYQNRTHNGIWEIIASNNAQTLTCSFVDRNGDKFDTFVINSGVTPPPATGTLDPFGITKLNATKSGGREWFNKWNNNHFRSITSAGEGVRNEDPDDQYLNLHNNADVGSASIDGHGICTMDGTARLYVNDANRVLKWENVEMTVYYRVIDTDVAASIHVHCRLAGRSEHQDEYLCCASGHTAGIFEIKEDTSVQLRKELIHPAYADNIVSGTAGGEHNQWIGMKLVLRNEAGKVHVIGYRDMTDGANGGTWTQMVEKLDDNDWPFTDPTEIATYDACSGSGTGTCVKITPRTVKIIGQANSCYLRIDGHTVEMKKFSIREIASL